MLSNILCSKDPIKILLGFCQDLVMQDLLHKMFTRILYDWDPTKILLETC